MSDVALLQTNSEALSPFCSVVSERLTWYGRSVYEVHIGEETDSFTAVCIDAASVFDRLYLWITSLFTPRVATSTLIEGRGCLYLSAEQLHAKGLLETEKSEGCVDLKNLACKTTRTYKVRQKVAPYGLSPDEVETAFQTHQHSGQMRTDVKVTGHPQAYVTDKGLFVRTNEVLGRGGFKKVSRGLFVDSKTFECRDVAISVMDIDGANSRRHLDAVEEEARAERIGSDYVIGRATDECVSPSGRHFCTVHPRYMSDATPLAVDAAIPNKTLDFADIITIALDAAKGVRDIHNAHYVHRDIKPGNILVRYDEKSDSCRAVVADLGLAKLRTFSLCDGMIVGTQRYRPREAEEGWQFEDDLYSLGVTLNEMCCYMGGCVPFIKHLSRNGVYYRPNREWLQAKARSHEERALQGIVRKLLSPRRGGRLSADQLINELEALDDYISLDL